jgi:TetR/AcrR family transcriptional regulator, tetracycline repressor protein
VLKRAKRTTPLKTPGATKLNKESIIAAAIALIDSKGADAFSIRELARSLDASPTSLYWHVPGNRNGLIGEILAAVLSDIVPPREITGDWKAWLRELFNRMRSELHKHPNIAPLLAGQMISNLGPFGERIAEGVLACLTEAGFGADSIVDVYNASIAAMVGFVSMELASAPSENRQEWIQEFSDRLNSLPGDTYPQLAKYRKAMINRAFIVRWKNGSEIPLDSGFEVYCQSFLDGLELRLLSGNARGGAAKDTRSKKRPR